MAFEQKMGMLGELFNSGYGVARKEEADDQARLERMSAMDGFQADRLASYQGADMAGKGLGGIVASAAGADPRTPARRNEDAITAAKAEVSKLGFNPTDAKSMDAFYRQTIQILQQKGLAAEALAVAKEWQEQKRQDTKTDLQNQELQRKINRDQGMEDLGWARIDALQKNGIKAGSAVGKILADMDKDENKTPERRELLMRGLSNVLDKGWKAVDLGDRVEIRSMTDPARVIDTSQKGLVPRDEAKADDKKQAAKDAYDQFLLGLQRQYNAAVDLYNNKGVPGMTGRFGHWVGEPGNSVISAIATFASPAEARAAYALHEQVVGGTFLSGLAQLKAASKTGATGLGAVSEREGDKVQADAAALSRLQEAPDYRAQLAKHIKQMELFAQQMASAAQTDGIAPKQLQTRPLAAPGRGGKVAPAAAPAAPSAPAAPAAPADDKVRVQAPDGTVGRMPRANLDRALKQGYKELP